MKKRSKELTLFIIFVCIFIILSILSPDRFLSIDNFQSMASQLPEFGIIAIGMMVVILTGGIDLSITSIAALSGITGAYFMTKSLELGISEPVSILVGVISIFVMAVICGLINGGIVAYIGVAPMLVTLGTMAVFEGISLNVTKGGAISGFPDAYSWFGNGSLMGIPVPMLLFIVVAIIGAIILERTPWGVSIYMLGNNPLATMYSGINIKKVQLRVYIFSALMAGISALIMTSRYNSAKVDYGSSYLLQSVAAVVLGGTDIAGGYGKVIGTVIAVAIIQCISSGFNLLGINRYLTDITMGVILLLVLAINFFSQRRHSFKLVSG